jgi:hypothetical protein
MPSKAKPSFPMSTLEMMLRVRNKISLKQLHISV